MELSLPPTTTISFTKAFDLHSLNPFPLKLHIRTKNKNIGHSSSLSSSFSSYSPIRSKHSTTTTTTTRASPTSTQSTFTPTINAHNHHWMVIMNAPPKGFESKSQAIDYYVNTLQSVLGSEKEAQMSIYDASWDTHFGFCCDIDEGTSLELACLPSVLSVSPDPDYYSAEKDYSSSGVQSAPLLTTFTGSNYLFPLGKSKHWIVRMEEPETKGVSKAVMVDHYTQVLTKVMGNYKDAQMCMYHISCQSNFGFCCELDEECAQELAGLPGILSVALDENIESANKDYGGENKLQSGYSSEPAATNKTENMKTRKLFITGLSFYTSEKTLREAFEGFGELVEVKIIMDKISRRSKGYAFVEYTTEQAAAAALKEMNGKIINGWLITVDVAKTNPPKYSRGRPRPAIR